MLCPAGALHTSVVTPPDPRYTAIRRPTGSAWRLPVRPFAAWRQLASPYLCLVPGPNQNRSHLLRRPVSHRPPPSYSPLCCHRRPHRSYTIWAIFSRQAGPADARASPEEKMARSMHTQEAGRVLEFDGVSFRYEEDELSVLREITFSSPAGKKIALGGPSGAVPHDRTAPSCPGRGVRHSGADEPPTRPGSGRAYPRSPPFVWACRLAWHARRPRPCLDKR